MDGWKRNCGRVSVYSFGRPTVNLCLRLKGGLKELDADFRKPMPERYAAANGANSWADYLKDYSNIVEKRWSELLFYRAELSSK